MGPRNLYLPDSYFWRFLRFQEIYSVQVKFKLFGIMEKLKYERPVINRIQSGLPDKFGAKFSLESKTDIEGFAVKDLLEQFGSPLYVVSENTIRNTYREVFQAFSTRYPKVQMAWSYKTNYLDAICRIYHEEGSWAEVVSWFKYKILKREI